MNDRMPTSATSPANQPSSGERGIDRLFSEMAAMYGSKFADLWVGADIEEVKAKWVEKLKPFAAHPGVVQAALKALDFHPNPPTLPVFLGLCRDAMRHVEEPTKALPHKLTQEDHDRIAKAARDAKRAVERSDMDKVEFWATHPRSHAHLRFILDAAANDRRFQPCIESMVKNGICTEDGHLLKSYREGQWWPVVHRAA